VDTDSDIDLNDVLETNSMKTPKKQFRYSALERVILLKEVINVNPFDVAHGLSGKAWDIVRDNFVSAVPRAKSYKTL
jgi:hypothetical protein